MGDVLNRIREVGIFATCGGTSTIATTTTLFQFRCSRDTIILISSPRHMRRVLLPFDAIRGYGFATLTNAAIADTSITPCPVVGEQ